jgi:hypothetical protein
MMTDEKLISFRRKTGTDAIEAVIYFPDGGNERVHISAERAVTEWISENPVEVTYRQVEGDIIFIFFKEEED